MPQPDLQGATQFERVIFDLLSEIRTDVKAVASDQIALGSRVSRLETTHEAEQERDRERKDFATKLAEADASRRRAEEAAAKAVADDLQAIKLWKADLGGRAWVLGIGYAAVLAIGGVVLGAWLTYRGDLASKASDAQAKQAVAQHRTETIQLLTAAGVKIPASAFTQAAPEP